MTALERLLKQIIPIVVSFIKSAKILITETCLLSELEQSQSRIL